MIAKCAILEATFVKKYYLNYWKTVEWLLCQVPQHSIIKLSVLQKVKNKSLHTVAIRSTYKSACTVVSLFFCGFRWTKSHSYFMCWEVEMLQMNYTGSRWPESKHLASFAWDFPCTEEQTCTYSKEDKRGSIFHRGETVQKSQFMQMMTGAIIWYEAL